MDPSLILIIVLVAVMAFFMFRSSRKRQQDAVKLQEQLVVGAEVMTQQGIFGTIVSIDREKNEAIIETTPGTKLRVHVQTLGRVVEPESPEVPAEDEAELDDSTAALLSGEPLDDAEPEYGERTPKPRGRRKPPADGTSE